VYYKQERIKFPDKVHSRDRNKRANNLEKIRKQNRIAKKKYRDENPKEHKKYSEAYREKNKDKLKAYDQERMLNRPEYFLFNSARGRARTRNLEFNIKEQDIKELLDKTVICPLRGVKFERGNSGIAIDNSASLDRINSKIGYTKDNIQIISYRANIVKSNIDLETFRKIVFNLRNFTFNIHAIDDETRNTIIQDRLKYIGSGNYSVKDKWRLFNAEKHLLFSAKRRAKKSKLEISIDENYIKAIWPINNQCPILNEKFVLGKKIISDLSATIDRIDNSKGYIIGNIRVISAKTNSVKNKMSLDDLELMLENWEKMKL
jgi:hypothetical protein